MERMCESMCVIMMNDWIKPLTHNLNTLHDLKLSEDQVIAMFNKDDPKQGSRPKRMSKQSSQSMYVARTYTDCLEVVKITGHSNLYRVDDSLVVYLAAQPLANCWQSQDAEEEEEYTSEQLTELEAVQLDKEQNPAGEDLDAMQVDREGEPSRSECDSGAFTAYGEHQGCVHFPDPEELHGYTFLARALAIGSIVNNNIVYLTEEDTAKCAQLGLSISMASKIHRMNESVSRQTGDMCDGTSSTSGTVVLPYQGKITTTDEDHSGGDMYTEIPSEHVDTVDASNYYPKRSLPSTFHIEDPTTKHVRK